jgi:hypothetical protein
MYEVCYLNFRKNYIKLKQVKLGKNLFLAFINIAIPNLHKLFAAFESQLTGSGEALFAVSTVDPNPLLLNALSLHLHPLFVEDLHELVQSLHDFVIICHGPHRHTFGVD